MQETNAKIWRAAERAMKRTGFFQENRDLGITDQCNYQLLYVLGEAKNPDPNKIYAVAGLDDSYYLYYPYWKDPGNPYNPCELWAFNYERDLFQELENGYRIIGMSDACHYDVWATIISWSGCIEAVGGLRKYMDYCRDNHVTKKKNKNGTGLDILTDIHALPPM